MDKLKKAVFRTSYDRKFFSWLRNYVMLLTRVGHTKIQRHYFLISLKLKIGLNTKTRDLFINLQ